MGDVARPFRESDLTGLADDDLATAFNTVYTDYIVPFAMSEAAARQHVTAYAIERGRSTLWRDEAGAIVGLAALGIRDRRGWVGGFGLAPGWRGRGLAGPLLARLLDRAREAGLRRVQLEVITTNARAIRTYERAGFRRVRELLILAGPDGGAARDSAPLHEADPLALLAAPPFAPAAPPWQRERESFAGRTDLHGLILGAPAAPRAFAVVSLAAGALSIGAIAGETPEEVSGLADALAARFPGRALRLGNEPKESPVPAALLRAGWREQLRQYELICELEPGHEPSADAT